MMKPDGIKGYVNWRENIGILAVNCSLSPCLRRYSGEISHGSLKENLVSQEPMPYGDMDKTLEGLTYHSWFIKLLEPCEIDGRWYDSSNITEASKDSTWISWKNRDNSTHEGPRDCVMGIQSTLSQLIAMFRSSTIHADRHFFDRIADPMSRVWLAAVSKMGNATLASISTAFDGMAAGYTDFIRNNWENERNDNYNVVGTAYKSAVCIHDTGGVAVVGLPRSAARFHDDPTHRSVRPQHGRRRKTPGVEVDDTSFSVLQSQYESG